MGAPTPLNFVCQAVPGPCRQQGSRVAPDARNGARPVRGGGRRLIPAMAGVTLLLYPMTAWCLTKRTGANTKRTRVVNDPMLLTT